MKNIFPDQIFVAGIGTGVGKTLTATILVEALQADYWKPLQCGNLDSSDTQFVQAHISNSTTTCFAETYRLKAPASPHYAAHLENVTIEIEKFKIPTTTNRLIIESAGGLLVPINDELVVFDLMEYFNVPVVVVVRNYLGSINHALLTIDFLEAQGAQVIGIIYSGNNFNDNEQIIEHFSGLPVLGRIDEAVIIDKNFVTKQANKMQESLAKFFEL